MSVRSDVVEAFPTTADPRNYVRMAASEDALEALERKVREGRAPVVLVGPPGIGKTLLLRVLAGRLAGRFRAVYLPFAALPADEICAWGLGLLDEIPGPDPERALIAASLRLEGAGSALVVILDDAGSMPVATARRLSALLNEAEGAIRLVMASTNGNRAVQMLSAFQPAPSRIEFARPMSVEEAARYVRAHLVRVNAPREVRELFNPTRIHYLHRGSGGIPRVLSGLASELARGNLSVLPHYDVDAREESPRSAADPFGVTSNPAAYVPRPTTRYLLEVIESALRDGACSIALTGSPGLGKTMLMRVLEQRLRGGFRALGLSYAALLPDELCRWILTHLEEPIAEDPEAALLALGRRLVASGTTLVLLLDDAGSIPHPTLQRLVELVGESSGAIRLVLFAVEDARTPAILAGLGTDVVRLRLDEPMSEDETAEYIYAHLAGAQVRRALIERFDPEVVARLHEESGGIPRELHKLASELIRERDEAVALPAAAPLARQIRARPEPKPAPAEPSRELGEMLPPKPTRDLGEMLPRKPEPVSARVPLGGRVALFALAAMALLLAAIPLLRVGFPWMPSARVADSVVVPSVSEAAEETARPPTPVESLALIPVNINATPWASVDVDGRYLGITPLSEVLLSPGPHVFRARMPDGEIRRQRLDVSEEMRHVTFEADLAPAEVEVETAAPPALAPLAPSEPTELAVASVPPAQPALPEIAVEEPPAPAVEAPAPVAEPAPSPEAALPEIAVEAPPAPAVEVPESVAEPAPLPEAPVLEPAVDAAPAPVAAVPEPIAEPALLPEAPPPALAARIEPAPQFRESAPASAPMRVEPISVSINAVPWAVIEIDGDEVGITPMAGVLLSPGEHRFRVRMADGTVLEETIQIASDNRHIAFGE